MRLAQHMAIASERVSAEAIEATEFPEMSQQYRVMAVPKVVINDRVEFEGAPGHVSLETAVFEDLGGKTLLRQRSAYLSVAARDAMVESGMEEGLNDGFDRLDELIERLGASH